MFAEQEIPSVLLMLNSPLKVFSIVRFLTDRTDSLSLELFPSTKHVKPITEARSPAKSSLLTLSASSMRTNLEDESGK